MRYFRPKDDPYPEEADHWGWDPEIGQGYWLFAPSRTVSDRHRSRLMLGDFLKDETWEEFALIPPDLTLVEGL